MDFMLIVKIARIAWFHEAIAIEADSASRKGEFHIVMKMEHSIKDLYRCLF